MAQSINEIPASAPVAHDLEPYHQLVELQKEIIRLAQQNERAKQECLELRDRVATEVFSRLGTRRSARQKINNELEQSPTMTIKPNLVSFVIKEPSTC